MAVGRRATRRVAETDTSSPEYPPRFFQRHRPGLGARCATAGPLEVLRPKLLFRLLHLVARRRSGSAKSSNRTAKLGPSADTK